MLRYAAVAAIALLLLGLALKSRQAPAEAAEAPVRVVGAEPEVEARAMPGGGHEVVVRHRLAASVSRASLVYRRDGADHTADVTDCSRAFEDEGDGAKLRADGSAIEVTLSARIPSGAADLRIVLEDETGTRIVPVRRLSRD